LWQTCWTSSCHRKFCCPSGMTAYTCYVMLMLCRMRVGTSGERLENKEEEGTENDKASYQLLCFLLPSASDFLRLCSSFNALTRALRTKGCWYT
jgi:hypothetical protein